MCRWCTPYEDRLNAATEKALTAINRMSPEQARLVRAVMNADGE